MSNTEGMPRRYFASFCGHTPFVGVEIGWEITDNKGEVLDTECFDPFGDAAFPSRDVAERAAREWGNVLGITFGANVDGSMEETFESMDRRGTREPWEVS